MVLLQIDSTSDVVFSTLNAGIGNLVWFWEASQAQKGRPRAVEPITHNPVYGGGWLTSPKKMEKWKLIKTWTLRLQVVK